MMINEEKRTNNYVELVGTISGGFSYSHEVYLERFLNFSVNVKRYSGVADSIPCLVSERLIRPEFQKGVRVELEGEFRSYNIPEGGLQLYLFVKKINITEREDCNRISLTGFICKNPIYRETPLGRRISDLMIAVNRQYNKSDYIPTIVWGRNAYYAKELPVGTKVQIEGRVQSRIYQKRIVENGNYICSIDRTAYEVSANLLGEIE